MELKLFCIHDAKIDAYTRPFYLRTTGEAERAFRNDLNKNEEMVANAEDYTLFELGSFEDTTAQFELLPTPHPVGKAISYLEKTKLKEVS